MALLLFLAGWLGRNTSTLMLAAIATGACALALRLPGQEMSSRLRGLLPAVFVSVFAYSGARAGGAWYYVLTEDRETAFNWLFGIGALGVMLVLLVAALRNRRGAALISAAASSLLLGSAAPIVETVVRMGAVTVAKPDLGTTAVPAPPIGYPAVQIWASDTDRFAARFPESPNRLEASAQAASGHAWQSVFEFPSGGALASVTVMPLPRGLAVSQHRDFAEGAHASFVGTLGALPSASQTDWRNWTDGRAAYWYEVDFSYEGTPIRGYGFWVFDGDRILRVSTAYPLALATAEQAVARYFPHTFVLLGRRVQ